MAVGGEAGVGVAGGGGAEDQPAVMRATAAEKPGVAGEVGGDGVVAGALEVAAVREVAVGGGVVGVQGEEVEGEVGLVGAGGGHGGHGIIEARDAGEVPGGAEFADGGGHGWGGCLSGKDAEGAEHGGVFPGPVFGEGVLAFVEEVEAVFGGGAGEFGEDGVPVGVAGLAEALEPLLGDFEAAAQAVSS